MCGEPAGFQQLQGRIHLASGPAGTSQNVAFIAFDILKDGDVDLVDLPLTERRARLEKRLARRTGPLVRLSEVQRGDGHAMFERAKQQGWEGLIGKRADSCYRVGRRSPEWVKLKLVVSQEFVVGGWTEPRGTRSAFGALLLGVYENGALEYVGHTGTGFDGKTLHSVAALMKPLETRESPFRVRPRTNERAHWVRPELVAEVKFTEWTADGKLRHPTYVGLRDDVEPSSVRREPNMPSQRSAARVRGSSAPRAAARPARSRRAGLNVSVSSEPKRKTSSSLSAGLQALLEQLQDLETRRANGLVNLPGGERLEVSNLHKVFWPEGSLTKGDLMRYYVQVSPFLLPVVADRLI